MNLCILEFIFLLICEFFTQNPYLIILISLGDNIKGRALTVLIVLTMITRNKKIKLKKTQ
jgi:hypothetical protein